NGYLVEGRDPDRYAARIAAILDDPTLATSMGMSGAERARRYTWGTAAGCLDRVYADLAVHSLAACS
ncbi:MAG TPA: hypothetical protein PLV68_05005, partial [Ilumatobacteraceae bacterium]|nr:hypothetical protein [Ilumatobacteraceae bacterium]